MCSQKNTPRKIGLMGGTFNPIHNGHLLIAENARAQYGLEKVYFIPTGPSPHKKNCDITAADIRYSMVEKAIADHPGFAVSSIEIDSEETSYTYRTLEKLTALYPNDCFYFIMGGDSLHDFESWKNPRRICELAHLLVAVRNDIDNSALLAYSQSIREKFHGEIDLLDTPNFSISSHEIRKRVQNGESIRYLVPENVRMCIEKKQLYIG